ncbi:MAG TPA: FixH family protein [Puia sp.]|nr:FixH family protein [Puia sp.]
MRLNWGNKLILVFLAFGGMISYMVLRCMQTPVDLVASEYYKDELSYQQVIDARQRAERLSGKVDLRREGTHLAIHMPREMEHMKLTGSIQLYCPSDAARDRHFVLRVDDEGRQDIGMDQIRPGHYIVRVQWQGSGEQYYVEEPLTIQ